MARFVIVILLAVITYIEGRILNGDPRCIYSSPSGIIDLNPLSNNDNTPRFKDIPDTQTGQYEYSWNPCVPFDENSCQGVEFCQVNPQDPTNDFVLGRPGESTFIRRSDGLYFVYTNMSPTQKLRQTLIKLECSANVDGVLVFHGENPTLTYNLTLTSKYACPKSLTTPLPATTPLPPVTTKSPRPGPGPDIFNLETITILLACILCCLFVLNCIVILGLLTRSKGQSQGHSKVNRQGQTNHAFQKKPLP